MARVTLFYPMYNELKSLTPMTEKALKVLRAVSEDFEILIIDDGSRDGSGALADELAAQHREVRVIHHEGNKGYGQALRTGFANASKDIVMYTDCDEPADLWLFAAALTHMEDAHIDMVIGYRLNRWDGVRRFVYSKIYNGLVRLLFGVHVRDINFSFKLIRREKLKKLHLGAGSVFIDGELLAEAARHKLRIFQMPVIYQPRKHGTSNFDSVRAAMYTFEEIWAYWKRRRTQTHQRIVPQES
ncbi:MAG: glycosyltransferase family 2 protein [Chloroflexi bacterium]|nr:glycosyltransferase family 2 protein [Chloroflexota bacterium]